MIKKQKRQYLGSAAAIATAITTVIAIATATAIVIYITTAIATGTSTAAVVVAVTLAVVVAVAMEVVGTVAVVLVDMMVEFGSDLSAVGSQAFRQAFIGAVSVIGQVDLFA